MKKGADINTDERPVFNQFTERYNGDLATNAYGQPPSKLGPLLPGIWTPATGGLCLTKGLLPQVKRPNNYNRSQHNSRRSDPAERA